MMSRDGRPPQPRRAATPVPTRSRRPSHETQIQLCWQSSGPLFVVWLVCVLLAADRAAPGLGRPPAPTEVGWPVRAAFYYPWYPESEHWATRYTPSLGKYDSSNPRMLATHVAQARYAGLDAFIASYWGQGTPTARRLPLLLDAAAQQGFHIAAYYEPESLPTPPSSAVLREDFDSLHQLAAHPAWLRVGGRPVLFVYNIGPEATCSAVSRLLAANAGASISISKYSRAIDDCPDQPDSWHQYVPAKGFDQQARLLGNGLSRLLQVRRIGAAPPS